MKRPRPPLAREDLGRSDALLTTGDVARLLRVHPKHVYRLLRRGLPGHRVGGEWRFLADQVRRWSGARVNPASAAAAPPPGERATAGAEAHTALPAALVATNGDIAVECLLGRLMAEGGPLFGHVQADRGLGLELLRRGAVLAAGCHGDEIPGVLANERLAFIRLVDRQVGLAMRRGLRLRSLRQIDRWRLASRPPSAGVRPHLDRELRRQGLDPDWIHSRAAVLPSHREVVCAVARGDADIGLASAAWASRVGLECAALCRETYGLLVRASLLGDPRIVRLCEVAQSPVFRKELEGESGYQAGLTGTISYEPIPAHGGS
jgi:putative molybdopterin biosynthesis protein